MLSVSGKQGSVCFHLESQYPAYSSASVYYLVCPFNKDHYLLWHDYYQIKRNICAHLRTIDFFIIKISPYIELL